MLMTADNEGGASEMQTVPVLAAVIERAGRYLICQRAAHKRHGGLWEFPGGKLEASEDWLAAARRELMEELGLTVRDVAAPLLRVHDPGSPFEIVFVPVVAEGEPAPTEHQEVMWVVATDLSSYELAPSDRRFAEWLVSQTHHAPRSNR
jgi:8-oxo-dGTP diphosphatase